MTGPARVITLRALGLGDFLTAVPALRAIEEAFPRAQHVLAAPAALSDLARLAGLRLDVLDTLGVESIPLTPGAPEVAVNLHGRGPESHRALLETRPQRLIAFHSPELGTEGPEWHEDEHEVVRWCRLLQESGIEADPTRLSIDEPSEHPPANTEGATVIHPGAKSAARRWSTSSWAEVARRLSAEGHRVIITGSSRERHIASDVARRASLSPEAVWAGLTDLWMLAALVAKARVIICGDTGVAHLATALGRPSVVLFGPTEPGIWGPPSNGPHVVLWKGMSGDPHARTIDPGLAAITPDEVTAAVRSLSVEGGGVTRHIME